MAGRRRLLNNRLRRAAADTPPHRWVTQPAPGKSGAKREARA
jgi:hypothetical protein